MILLDLPFVSDFLIKTIKDNNFEVVATQEAKKLVSDSSLHWISEEAAIQKIKQNSQSLVYSNSENSISWIEKNLSFSRLPKQLELFKDKIKFRELLKDLFPNFYFKSIALEDIRNLNIEAIGFPFVIKPSIGFFSIGVHIIYNQKDWENAKKELNYENLQSIYPASVLNASTFIIEQFIEGEEFAIDCYFDQQGTPVILGILHHKFSSSNDVSDRMYSTSKRIILKYKNALESFLKPIGEKAKLTNFPMHIEVRITAEGNILPIEINPMRFGGWCTTADLNWYAYGINSYEYFFKGIKPNWNHILSRIEEKIYSIIILDNNSGINADKIKRFNFTLLKQDLEKVLEIRELNIKKDPVFGFVFTETRLEKENELNKILTSNLKKYIVK